MEVDVRFASRLFILYLALVMLGASAIGCANSLRRSAAKAPADDGCGPGCNH
jgi:hypothetical protein